MLDLASRPLRSYAGHTHVDHIILQAAARCNFGANAMDIIPTDENPVSFRNENQADWDVRYRHWGIAAIGAASGGDKVQTDQRPGQT